MSWRWLAPLALGGVLAAQQQDENTPVFRTDVKLVNVFTSVSDLKGVPVPDLRKEDFEVFEDGRKQDIRVFQKESALSLSIALELDTSLSTRKDLKVELDAARRFVHATLRPERDQLSIFTIAENVDQVLPFTGDQKRIDRALLNIHFGAATAMYDGLYLGSEALKEHTGRKVLVMITDGGDTVSRTSYQEALRSALEAEAIIYSIIVVPVEASAGRNTGGEHALIQASEDTGGRWYYAGDPEQIERAFRQISDELRTQYLLAYYPNRRLSDSDFRRIEVRVTGAQGAEPLKVRYRAGYYTH